MPFLVLIRHAFPGVPGENVIITMGTKYIPAIICFVKTWKCGDIPVLAGMILQVAGTLISHFSVQPIQNSNPNSAGHTETSMQEI